MRTLTLREWTWKNWLNNLVHGERRYHVEGSIAFEMLYSDSECYLRQIEHYITLIDQEYPWKDDVHPEDIKSFKSIFYLFGEVETNNDKRIWFHIFPQFQNMRKSQVYAYEKYLAKIAKELTWQFKGHVKEVRSGIQIRATTSFDPWKLG